MFKRLTLLLTCCAVPALMGVAPLDARAQAPSGAPVDACKLLTAAEAGEILKARSRHRPQTRPERRFSAAANTSR